MTQQRKSHAGGFKSYELIAVVAVIATLLLVLLPAYMKSKRRFSRVGCVNNLKQIGLSVRLWGDDNGGRAPSQVSTNEGGAMEHVESGSVARYFQVMSNELGTTKIVACYDDNGRTAATNFAVLSDTNISFFIVPEADGTITNLWLAGDRHIATNHVPLRPGIFMMPTNGLVSWADKLDIEQRNLCYADGRVEKPASAQLQASGLAALRAYRQDLGATNASFRLVIP